MPSDHDPRRAHASQLHRAWFALAAIAAVLAPGAGAAPAAIPWLFVSDVHYDIDTHGGRPHYWGGDTNTALLDGFLAAAKAADPDPPVVVIGGDFVAHNRSGPITLRTIVALAKRFDRTFPRAQFLITLGNNDSPCGDYAAPAGDAFLRVVAHAWKPLVDRYGAAPNFEQTFAKDGSYVARLPIAGLRAVVIDDVFFALRFNPRCGANHGPSDAFGDLVRSLAGARAGGRNWVLFHIPPGIDAFSTAHLTHHLIVVPFVRPRARDALLEVLGSTQAHVALVVAGHTHKFAFRILPGAGDGVPLLLIPSVSPIFGNAPSFLLAGVRSDGTPGDVVEYAYDGTRWRRFGDLRSLGVPAFTAPNLRALLARLERDSGLRERFSQLYGGGAEMEIDARNWRTYWCAATQFGDTPFERCTGRRGLWFLTGRGVIALGTVTALGFVALSVALFLRARRRRRA